MHDAGALRPGRVARAFMAVPRERFVAGVELEEAYEDAAIVIKRDGDEPISSSSQPSMMALMLAQLEAREGERVLEIGTGSGYNAALLSHVVGTSGSVLTVDIDDQLISAARPRLEPYANVRVACGDGDLLDFIAPGERFDRIIVTAAASEVSPAQFAALHEGGRIVLPLELGALQSSVAFERTNDRLRGRSCVGALFMPLRGVAPHLARATRLNERTFLRLARDGPVDAAEAWRLLATGGTHAPGPALGADSPQFDALSCWLDVCEPTFCLLTAGGTAAEEGVIPTISRPSRARDRVAFTYGCLARGSFALLERTAQVLGMRVYGGDAAESALRAGIERWVAAGRPSQNDLRIEVAFGELPSAAPGIALSRRSRSTLILSWGL